MSSLDRLIQQHIVPRARWLIRRLSGSLLIHKSSSVSSPALDGFQDQLTYSSSWMQGDGNWGHVADLKDLSVPSARLNQAGGHVYHQAYSSIARTTLQPSSEVIRQLDAFARNPVHQLSWLQQKIAAVFHRYAFCEAVSGNVVCSVNDLPLSMEDPKLVTQGQVYAARPHLVLAEGSYLETPFSDQLQNGTS